MLDILGTTMQVGVYTFFLICSVAEFHWTEIMQVVARQYGQTLTNAQVNSMDQRTKLNYWKWNQVTVTRQIDYVFKQLWGNVILCGMHHKTTCRKKKGVVCRFNAPWAPSGKYRIVHSEEKIDEAKVKHSKIFIDKVLSYIVTINDLSDVTLWEHLEAFGAIAEQYTMH